MKSQVVAAISQSRRVLYVGKQTRFGNRGYKTGFAAYKVFNVTTLIRHAASVTYKVEAIFKADDEVRHDITNRNRGLA